MQNLLKCLTIFGISMTGALLMGSSSFLDAKPTEPNRSPNGLQLVGGTGAKTAGACARNHLPKVPTFSPIQQMKFGTGDGKIITGSPRTFKDSNGREMVSFTEIQRNEEDAIIVVMDEKANRIVREFEIPGDKASPATPFQSDGRALLPFTGRVIVHPKPGIEVFIADPLLGKVSELTLPLKSASSRILFPRDEGDSIIIYDGHQTFTSFDVLYDSTKIFSDKNFISFRKAKEWKLDSFIPDGTDTSLLRVPGTKNQVLLVSKAKLTVINTEKKSIEATVEGNFSHNAKVIETDAGPVLAATDFGAMKKTDDKYLQMVNLLTMEHQSIKIGVANDSVTHVEHFKIADKSYFVLAMKTFKPDQTVLTAIDVANRKLTWSSVVPTEVRNITFHQRSGHEPVLVLSYPGRSESLQPELDQRIEGTTALEILNGLNEVKPTNGSFGYIYSVKGDLKATVEFAGGLKTVPYVTENNGKLALKYQNMTYDTLGTIEVPRIP